MSKKYIHFKGVYRGVFSKKPDQSAHGHQFAKLSWEWLEVSKLERMSQRDFEREKVNDFIYLDEIKPKKRWRGVDLLIELPDGKTYSEPIYQVVLKGQAGGRHTNQQTRQLGTVQLGSHKGVASGEIYFSIPIPEEKVQPKVSQPTLVSVVSTPISDTTLIGNIVPNVVVDQILGGNAPAPTNKMGCLKSGCAAPFGCLGGIFKALKWIFILSLLIGVIQFLGGLLKQVVEDQPVKTKKGNVQLEAQRLDPKQDTLAPQPWNYLVGHEIAWSDFHPNDFLSRYTTSTLAFAASNKMHGHWSQFQGSNELDFWHDLYQEFYQKDSQKLDSLVLYFSKERASKKLSALETAEMVTTFIQEIPYCLVHDGSCQEASRQGGFVAQYHAEGKTCLPEVIGGVQSPYEFIHNLKGDCDTRSLLGYTILSKLGIASSVWVSREYGHSILGVAVPVNSSNYKVVSGTRYFGVELTAKGFRIGMIAPENTNMNNWNVVLN